MASSKASEYLTQLLVENDEDDDFVRFTFQNEKNKVKCSSSLLSQKSLVFKTMLSEKWCKEKTVAMDDFVEFHQYFIFKLFVGILYGIQQINSLTIVQATDVFFYSHKYQVEDVNAGILSFIGQKIKVRCPSFAEMIKLFTFTKFFELDDLARQLDEIKLNLNSENCFGFYNWADELKLVKMKQQILDYCGTIEAREEWAPEFLRLIIANLQRKQKMMLKDDITAKCVKALPKTILAPDVHEYIQNMIKNYKVKSSKSSKTFFEYNH